MVEPGKKLIGALLDRLYANLVNGPLMSCRPHASRQRVDLSQLAKLKGPDASGIVAGLLGKERAVKLTVPSEGSRTGSRSVPRSDDGDDTEPEPPSIGVACFNLTQRDLIIDALDRASAEDSEFANRLAQARARQGQASFEGLFVRNLESVQGDERDHIIISTTFGLNQYGKFRRNFGPLGQAGGGRRLNVLVTRARSMVHLVTSIPREVYQSQPELPAGTKPNGALLLFQYLAYAEELERLYEQAARRIHSPRDITARCNVQESRYPSPLATALGQHLEGEHGISSVVHWGNDGFGVDAALVHPDRAGDVTIGVLCDGSRFEKAADRVQWDIFRSEMLEAQRWRLHRLWSPRFFRDPKGTIAKLKKAAEEWLAEERAKRPRSLRAQAPENTMLN